MARLLPVGLGGGGSIKGRVCSGAAWRLGGLRVLAGPVAEGVGCPGAVEEVLDLQVYLSHVCPSLPSV